MKTFFTFLYVVSFATLVIGQDCNCQQYIYLNEPGINSTLKFSVNADGSLTEILGAGGNHWAEGTTNMPHGLAQDQNGALYIGNIVLPAPPVTRGVDKYACDGTVIQLDAIPPAPDGPVGGSSGSSTNMYIVNGVLYMNNWVRSGYPAEPYVFAYDVCTGDLIGTYLACGNSYAWDIHIDEASGKMYVNIGRDEGVAVLDLVADLDGPCVNPTLAIGQNFDRGILIDDAGNMFIRSENELQKFDSAGNLVCTTDLTLSGGSNSWGIVFNPANGYLYLAGEDADCVAVYDTDCNYVIQGFPNPGGGGSKAIDIATECCPTNAIVEIDTTFCNVNINDSFNLQDLFSCDAPVCEGLWEGGNAAFSFNDCNSEVTINSTGCATFTKASDGTAPSAQCGAFMITINVCVELDPICINRYGDFTIQKRRP